MVDMADTWETDGRHMADRHTHGRHMADTWQTRHPYDKHSRHMADIC